MLFQSGFRFSPINYDMSCGHLPNYFNLQANMYMADSIARSSLYNIPMFNMGAMSPYGGVSIPGEYIFQYTLNQAHYQSLQMGGPGIFNSDGSLNLTNNIWGGYGYGSQLGTSFNPFGGFTPWTQGNGSTSGSGKTDDERRAEAKIQNKYDKLKELLKAYVKTNKDIDEDLKIDIDLALKKTGKLEEKYNALKEVAKNIDLDDLRSIIPNLEEYRTQLVEAGYDFDNSECFKYENEAHTKLVDDARQAIKDILATSGNVDYSQHAGLTVLATHFSSTKNYVDILNVISLWNENKESGRLILELQKVVKKVAPAGTGESESRISATKKLVEPLVEAIKAKAAECRKEMTPDEKEELDALKTALENATSNVVTKPMTADWDVLSTAFDDLYTFLRKAEAKRINKEINDKYGFLNDIQEGVIDNEIIVDDTENDLESEKITDFVIDNYSYNTNNVSATQRRVDSKVRNNVLDEVKIDGVTYYQETKETGDRDYKRVFAIVNDKVKVVKDVKIEDGKLVNLNGEPASVETIQTEEVEVDDIQAAYDAVREKESAEEALEEAGEIGSGVRNAIDSKYCKPAVVKEWQAKIDQIDEKNVMQFLESAYSEEGIFERSLFVKGTRKGIINRDGGLKIINAILTLAEKNNLTDDNSYAKLAKIRDMYSDGGKHATKNEFSGLNWEFFFDAHATHKAIIDECIADLYREIKKEQKKMDKEA